MLNESPAEPEHQYEYERMHRAGAAAPVRLLIMSDPISGAEVSGSVVLEEGVDAAQLLRL